MTFEAPRFTHLDPFHPAITRLYNFEFVIEFTSLLEVSQVKIILVAVVPLMSQYSLVLTKIIEESFKLLEKGAPVGNAGKVPEIKLAAVAVFGSTLKYAADAEDPEGKDITPDNPNLLLLPLGNINNILELLL
jgi:hypothetical protein